MKPIVCFLKNGDAIEEYHNVLGRWKDNPAKLIWDMYEVSKQFPAVIISGRTFEKTPNRERHEEVLDEHIHVHSLRIEQPVSRLLRVIELIRYHASVWLLLVKYRPAFLIAADISFLFLYLPLSKLFRINYVPYFTRDTQLTRMNLRLLKLFSICDAIVCANYMAGVLKKAGLECDTQVRFPNYPEDFFKDIVVSDFPDHEFNVLFCARLEEAKGVFEVIDSAKKIVQIQPDIGFVFLGDGPARRKLELKARKSEIKANVHFLGEKDQILVGTYMRKSDILVLPSYTEGFAKTWLEGIYSEIPIITTPLPGAVEIFDNNKTALFVRKRNADDIVEAVLKIYNDREFNKNIIKELQKLKENLLSMPDKSLKTNVLRVLEKGRSQ